MKYFFVIEFFCEGKKYTKKEDITEMMNKEKYENFINRDMFDFEIEEYNEMAMNTIDLDWRIEKDEN